jgi:hypothetical protein
MRKTTTKSLLLAISSSRVLLPNKKSEMEMESPLILQLLSERAMDVCLEAASVSLSPPPMRKTKTKSLPLAISSSRVP